MMSHISSTAQQNCEVAGLAAVDNIQFMIYLATGDTRTQLVLADRYFLVHNAICEIVLATGHGTDKNRN